LGSNYGGGIGGVPIYVHDPAGQYPIDPSNNLDPRNGWLPPDWDTPFSNYDTNDLAPYEFEEADDSEPQGAALTLDVLKSLALQNGLDWNNGDERIKIAAVFEYTFFQAVNTNMVLY
jgi:hypothetical protein